MISPPKHRLILSPRLSYDEQLTERDPGAEKPALSRRTEKENRQVEFWAKQIVATKSRIRALPHEIKGAIPHLTSEEVEEVRRLVDRTLTDLADGIPPDAAAVGPGKATDILDLAE